MSESDSPCSYYPKADGTLGVLQVSRFPDADLAFIAAQPDLGAFAGEFGRRLGAAGQNWGECTMGRFGLAVFVNGEYPAMFLWVTVAPTAAYLWTWLGGPPVGNEIQEALQIMLTARAG